MTFALCLRFLHILSAALWMGSGLFWPGALRRALLLEPPAPGPALAQAQAGAGLDLGSGLAVLATGLAYASPLGGASMRMGIALGLLFALARLVLVAAVARPAIGRIREALGAGDLVLARAASRKLLAYSGSAHLLWLLALVVMVFPI
ncbi:MAG TPA: hypothetical protein VLV17_06820 [Anaeromyxobacteraceae bacterium]|nr:hypothetical protein [Anaeromyxobacteraceae bacterium]